VKFLALLLTMMFTATAYADYNELSQEQQAQERHNRAIASPYTAPTPQTLVHYLISVTQGQGNFERTSCLQPDVSYVL
jgi:hypothetical protein